MKNKLSLLRAALFFLSVLILFGLGLTRLKTGQENQGRILLDEAVRRSAAACYASEGFYPPDISYIQENYGLQWNPDEYSIHYEVFASNLMPDITVLSK